MNERQATVAAMKRLAFDPELDVTKHSDRFTAGVPDVSSSGYGVTCWMEFKRKKPGERWKDIVESIQLIKMLRLSGRTDARAWFIALVGPDKKPQTMIFTPRAMKDLCTTDINEKNLLTAIVPEEIPHVDPYELLRYGRPGLLVDGWNVNLIYRLVRRAGLR